MRSKHCYSAPQMRKFPAGQNWWPDLSSSLRAVAVAGLYKTYVLAVPEIDLAPVRNKVRTGPAEQPCDGGRVALSDA